MKPSTSSTAIGSLKPASPSSVRSRRLRSPAPRSSENTAAPSVEETIEPSSSPSSVENPNSHEAANPVTTAVISVPGSASPIAGRSTGRISPQPAVSPPSNRISASAITPIVSARWKSSNAIRPRPSDPIAMPSPRKSTSPGSRTRPATSDAASAAASRAPTIRMRSPSGKREAFQPARLRCCLAPISPRIGAMTELLVGTRKGLFVLDGEPGSGFEVTARAFAGEPVEYALRDPRSGRMLASVTSPFYGPKIWYSDDAAGDWQQADGVALPSGGEAALERVWVIVTGADDGTLYAGGDPGVLLESRDGGASFELNRGALGAPHAAEVAAGRRRAVPALDRDLAGRAGPDRAGDLRRRRMADRRPRRDLAARQRRPRRALPARGPPPDEIALCVHRLQRAAARPERIFMQFHGGVYRSDDAGETWNDIAAGLPSDFGFPLAVDPADPDSAYVIPLTADIDRVTPDGRVRVYETRDGGASWTPRGDGLPAEHAYLTVLREAFGHTGEGEALELYFGATSGAVFGSGDAGATWFDVAENLPPVLSVAAAGARVSTPGGSRP